jgi:hypothetical protein
MKEASLRLGNGEHGLRLARRTGPVRCTRCDRILIRQAVGTTPRGVVVFGWCEDCLAETQCRLVEMSGSSFEELADPCTRVFRTGPALRPKAAAKMKTTASRPRSNPDPSRRLMISGIAGMLGLWALLLIAVGFVRLPRATPANPMANGWASLLLVSGAAMAVMSLVLWSTTLERVQVRRLWLKTVQLAATALACSALVWGLVHLGSRRLPLLLPLGLLAVIIAWLAHRAESRLRRLWNPTEGGEPRASGSAGTGGSGGSGSIVVNLEDDDYEVF